MSIDSVYACALGASHGAHGKFEMAKLKLLARWHRAVLRLSVCESASEVIRSGSDAQVVSRHRYLVAFHPFVEYLTVFHTSGLVLASSSIFRVLKLNLHAIGQWHPERHMPKGTQTMHKPVHFNCKPVTDIDTSTSSDSPCLHDWGV